MDETNASHKTGKPRKSSAHLPIPTHTRTASSPSQLIEIGSQEVLVSHHKRYPSNIEQRTLDNQRAERLSLKQDSKKLSLDSNISDKIPKRTSSDISDKHIKRTSSNATDNKAHQKRSLDEMRLSQSSRTPSERSFILNTPETPKTMDATPELLAELLKGSSERLVTELHHNKNCNKNTTKDGNNNSGNSNNSNSSGSTALPTAVLKCLVSTEFNKNINFRHVYSFMYLNLREFWPEKICLEWKFLRQTHTQTHFSDSFIEQLLSGFSLLNFYKRKNELMFLFSICLQISMKFPQFFLPLFL